MKTQNVIKLTLTAIHEVMSLIKEAIAEMENKGIANRIAQKLFKKPKISYVHLDKMGSFVWSLIDGEKSIVELGEAVEEKFGEEAHPLYERLAKYFQILDSYHFISWNDNKAD